MLLIESLSFSLVPLRSINSEAAHLRKQVISVSKIVLALTRLIDSSLATSHFCMPVADCHGACARDLLGCSCCKQCSHSFSLVRCYHPESIGRWLKQSCPLVKVMDEPDWIMHWILNLFCYICCCFERGLQFRDVKENISVHKASSKDQIVSWCIGVFSILMSHCCYEMNIFKCKCNNETKTNSRKNCRKLEYIRPHNGVQTKGTEKSCISYFHPPLRA